MNVLTRNNVHVQGEAGPVLLYAHGFGCNQDMWRWITPAFRATNRQVLFDYVGSGKSDLGCFKAERYASLSGYAQDLLDVCDALELKSEVTFVGHSVSCSIGMLAAIARPTLFSRMVMLGPSPCFLDHPPDYHGGFARQDLEELLALMEQNYIGWANHLAPIVAGEAASGELSGQLSSSFCSTDPVAARVFARATFFADNRRELSLLSCPLLILQHREDALAPTGVGEYVHAHVKGSTLKVLDITGHCAHMSRPPLVIEAMREWFDSPSAAP